MNNSFDGRVIPIINGFKQFDNGGKGSGNYGHAGRKGKVGGSSPKGVSVFADADKAKEDLSRAIEESDKMQELHAVRSRFYRDFTKYEKDDSGRYVKVEPKDKKAYRKSLDEISAKVSEVREYDSKSDNKKVLSGNAKIARIEEKIGKKALLVSEDLADGHSSSFMDEDGKEYWYDSRSEEVKDYGIENPKTYLSPAVKKSLEDKTPWNEYELKGSDIKKKLKGYGINTDGLSISKGRGGYETAWHISGSSLKTDLASVETIVKSKIGHVDYDEHSGEILAGGNTYVFVSDEDRY